MEQVPADWPPDKRSRFVLRKFPNNRFIRKLRAAGVLAADEQVIAGVPMSKRSPAIVLLAVVGILPALIVLFTLQRFSVLIVTNRRVLVTPWSMNGKKAEGMLQLNRPVNLALTENPKPSHFFGNKVRLSQEIAQFLGRETTYTQLGNVADYAFREARGTGAGDAPAPPAQSQPAPAATPQPGATAPPSPPAAAQTPPPPAAPAATPPPAAAPAGYEGSITIWARDERTAQDLVNDRFYLFGALKSMEGEGNESARMFLEAMNKGQSWSASTAPNAAKGGFDVTLTLR